MKTPPWEQSNKTGVKRPPWKPKSGPAAKAKETPSSQKLAHRTEENITPKMKLRRDNFVAQFIIDWDQTKACMRMGISSASAAKQGSEFMREPYVQQQLTKVIDEIEEDTLISRNRILAGLWRESNSTGIGANSSSRVSALSKLAKLKGMEIERMEIHNMQDAPALTKAEIELFKEVFDDAY